MAILKIPLPEHIRGSVNGIIVIKHWRGKTIVTAFPDMSKVVFSDKQKAEQKRFADAVAYAKAIIRDPQKKAVYQAKLPKGKRVFNAAITEYMTGKKVADEKGPDSGQVKGSYAQKPLSEDQGRSRTECGLAMKKFADFCYVLSPGEPVSQVNSASPG